jgi:hypothetical protein
MVKPACAAAVVVERAKRPAGRNALIVAHGRMGKV